MIASRRALLGLAALAIGAAAAPAIAQQPAPIRVVASFSILADLVRQIGGDRVSVSALVGPNGDAHVFQPTPADARRLSEAQLIFVNGLGYEGWMDRLVKASGTKAGVVVVSRGVTSIKETGDDHAAGAAKGHDHGSVDPHAWQDVANAKLYVAAIRDALVAADPAGKAVIEDRAAAYLAQLDALDREIRAAIAKLAPERRRIITSHDAFAYFGAAYGIDFVALQGVSTQAEASAKDVARIIRQVRAQKTPAVFLENVSDARLMERITRETGARIGGRLFSDALSQPDGPAGTYIDMMRTNIRELSVALSS
jgi:zinc/manganese transport system substrate-binding protein